MKTKFLFALLAVLFTACGTKENKGDLIYALDEDMTYSVAVMTGSTQDVFIADHYPKIAIQRYDNEPDVITALQNGKVDLIAIDETPLVLIAKKHPGMFSVKENAFTESFGVGFNKKQSELRKQFNAFLAETRKSGLYDQIKDKWLGDPENAPMPEWDYVPTGKPLVMGCTGVSDVYAFVRDGKPVGLDVELLQRFAYSIGRSFECKFINFGGLISALVADKVDMISSGMTITEERSKQIDFSDPYFLSKSLIVCLRERDGNLPENHGETSVDGEKKLSGLEDLNTSKVALVTGLLYDQYVIDNYPQSTVLRFDAYPDVFNSLDRGVSDIALVDGVVYEANIKSTGRYAELGVLFEDPYGVGFSYKNVELRDRFNQFLKEIKSNGVYDEIENRWIKNYATAEMPVWTDTPTGKPLKLGCTGATDAFDFIKNGRNAGFDIEMMERFGRYINRPIEYYNLNFGGLIAALSTGTVDAISSAMTITAERGKTVAFSDPYYVSRSLAISLRERYAGNKEGQGFRTMEDVRNKRFGVLMGSIQDEYVAKTYPEAQILRIDLAPDLLMSLKTNQSDVIILPQPEAEFIVAEDPNIGVLNPDVYTIELGIGFKDTALRDQFNTYLASIRESGLYKEIEQRWMKDYNVSEMPHIEVPKGSKPLVVGTTSQDIPFSFIKEGVNSGFDMEIVTRFAASINRSVRFETMTFGGLIPALMSGKIDVMASAAMITEERRNQIAFSDAYYTIGSSVLALKKNLASTTGYVEADKGSFVQQMKDSFYNNLVREKRYMLILEGLWQTLIITIFATLFGTILGGFVCFLRMRRSHLVQGVAKIYIDIMRGTPLLVMLMIFFYVVFASSGLNATVVAIFTFALNMAAYSSEMFRTAINAVDPGQKEAGIAMGFSQVQTFIYIILPQAARNVLPVYKGEVISLLKTTSIVGYIAVVDLTKASDIIRSRTFDAFFPLIIVAVIYFLLAWLFGLGLDYLNKKISPSS